MLFASIPSRILPLLLLLSGCSGRSPHPVGPLVAGVPHPEPVSRPAHHPPDYPRLQGGYHAERLSGDYAGYPALEAFIQQMELRHGFPRAYLLGLFSGARRKQWTLDYMARDTPSPVPNRIQSPRAGGWSRYRSQFLGDYHINRGVEFWRRNAAALSAARRHYGVPEAIILGILGVETAYGANLGKDRILDALTTLAFDYPRRAGYFTDELENFLLMTRSEGLDPAQPRGSFAGAMGLSQFMPGSFLKWAEDLDGDGRRDLWNPADAIGSVARYFAVHGWKPGEPVVTRARASGLQYRELEYGYDKPYSLSRLAAYGIEPAEEIGSGRAAGQAEPVFRFLRLGVEKGEEHWLGHENFYVITRYNHSTYYAMAVYQLAEVIRRRHERQPS